MPQSRRLRPSAPTPTAAVGDQAAAPFAGASRAGAAVASARGDPADTSADMCEVRCIDAPTVTRVRAEMPAPGDVALAAERLKLLGDPTRLRLLAALARADELCVCDLTLIVRSGGGPGVTESAVSHALRGLRLAGMVTFRKARKVAYYRLADAATRQLVTDLFRPTGA